MSDLDAIVGRWLLFPWFEEHGVSHVYPDDLDALRRLQPYGKLFLAIRVEDDFLQVAYGETALRVRAGLANPVSCSPHPVGESVTLLDGRPAVVVGVQWHHARSEPFYSLKVNGKRKTKRYWGSDLR